MSTSLERRPPKVVAMLKVFSPEQSIDKPVVELLLQSLSVENGTLVVVAHRHINQLGHIRMDLERDRNNDQPEIFCMVAEEHHAWTYKAKYDDSEYQHRENGVYPVIRFEIIEQVASVAEKHDFSEYNNEA